MLAGIATIVKLENIKATRLKKLRCQYHIQKLQIVFICNFTRCFVDHIPTEDKLELASIVTSRV